MSIVYSLISEIGQFQSDKQKQLADLISEYDPYLSLVYVPENLREVGSEFEFAILHVPENMDPYVARYVRLEDMDERLLAWVYCSDDNDVNAKLDAEEKAKRAVADAKFREVVDEQLDFTKSVLEGKNYYKHNGKVYS